MKKYTLLLIGVLCAIPTVMMAQLTKTQLQDTIKSNIITANNLKSGNWQDVFNSFFQLAVNDLTGQQKSFDFKSTLMALRLKSNPNLNVDTNYVKNTFSRNFQFDVSLKTNSSYKFNGFSGGFNWAIINKRDSTLVRAANIGNIYFKHFFDNYSDVLISYRRSLTHDTVINGKRSRPFKSHADFVKYNKLNAYVNNHMANGTLTIDYHNDSIPREFKLADSIYYKKADSIYVDALNKAKIKPLLTFSMNGIADSSGKVNSGNASLVYLQGIKSKGSAIEIDARCNTTLKDTSINDTSQYRSLLTATLGINFSLASGGKDKNNSILEFKPYLEYDRVLSGFTGQEKQTPDKFLFDADLRIKVTTNLWIPITIKYDTKNNNFLGFLNVTINLGALKK